MNVVHDSVFPPVVAIGGIGDIFSVRQGVDILYLVVIYLDSIK